MAEGYDELWSRHVAGPNARLTEELALRRGERLADLACGTGLYTLDMARRVTPSEVVGVDYSDRMLAAARERAEAADLELTLVHAKAEDFIAHAEEESFDAVSLRFALAYLDWRDVLPRMGRLLRRGGRVGVLSSTSTSIPQFLTLVNRFRKSPEPAFKLFQHTKGSLPDTWRIYRQLRETYNGDTSFIMVPDSAAQIAERLERGGLVATHTWTDTIRLWFESGRDTIGWMIGSGYATHSSLERLPPFVRRFLESLFAAGMESFRQRRGVPLDLVIAGVVAERR